MISKPILTAVSLSLQPIFAAPRTRGRYLCDRSKLEAFPTEGNISIPLVVDTEYVPLPLHWSDKPASPRQRLTTQVKGIAKDATRHIFIADKDFHNQIASHPTAKQFLGECPLAVAGFHPVDHLRALGYRAELSRIDYSLLKDLPVAEFALYGHFFLAEFLTIADGPYKADLAAMIHETKKGKPRVEMNRRLRTVTGVGTGDKSVDLDYVDLPWQLTLEGQKYAVRLFVVDTGALHGQASYKDICKATGVELTAKDNFTSVEKRRMDLMALTRPEDFVAYALGDLEVYEALENNAKHFRQIYDDLGVGKYYQEPKLTIGATVKDLFIAVLKNALGIEDKESWKFIEKFLLRPASAQYLRENATETAALLAKVEGGRARNNRPLVVALMTLLVDLDIAGCYGEGQRNQEYFVGGPEVISFPAGSDRNDYMTLRKFDKSYGSKLVPGGWFARASTSERLEHPQDFLASWFLNGKAGEDLLARHVAKMGSDTEEEGQDLEEFDEEAGGLKIFNYEVLNGVITSDFMDWLYNVATPQQREELLDKLVIKTAIYYDKHKRVESYKILKEEFEKWEGQNKVVAKGKGKAARNIREDGEYHGWISLNIGELIIDDLLSNRKLHPKKTPLNTLFKLNINTLYGDMVSKFFTVANVVVGNNITARARALAWYMEKGLYGFQTITDGCVFEPNRVVYPLGDRRVTGVNVVNLYRESKPARRQLRLAPLGGYDRIDTETVPYQSSKEVSPGKYEAVTRYAPKLLLHLGDNVEVIEPVIGLKTEDIKVVGEEEIKNNAAVNWFNKAAMEHLQMLFPNVAVLHGASTSLKPGIDPETRKAIKRKVDRLGQFEFEAKDIYTSGTFHGAANYCLKNQNGQNLKMRAYEAKKEHESVVLEEAELTVTDRYGVKSNPASDFMAQLENPDRVKRQDVFVKEAMLKPSDEKNRAEAFGNLGIQSGDSYYKAGLLREFSLSQLTYQTLEQFHGWEKAVSKAKDKLGESVERFFVNADGTLNFQLMIETLDRMVAEGVKDPIKTLEKLSKLSEDNHPAFETLNQAKAKVYGLLED